MKKNPCAREILKCKAALCFLRISSWSQANLDKGSLPTPPSPSARPRGPIFTGRLVPLVTWGVWEGTLERFSSSSCFLSFPWCQSTFTAFTCISLVLWPRWNDTETCWPSLDCVAQRVGSQGLPSRSCALVRPRAPAHLPCGKDPPARSPHSSLHCATAEARRMRGSPHSFGRRLCEGIWQLVFFLFFSTLFWVVK